MSDEPQEQEPTTAVTLPSFEGITTAKYELLKRLPTDASEHLRKKLQEDADFNFFLDTLVPEVDYGIIPGTKKPTLYQPGAQRIAQYLDLVIVMKMDESIEHWGLEGEEPFFAYTARCDLFDRQGNLLGSNLGHANSLEQRYGRRWLFDWEFDARIPRASLATRPQNAIEPEWAITRKQTQGPYGKPLSYWEAFEYAVERAKESHAIRTDKKRDDYDPNFPGYPDEAQRTAKEKKDGTKEPAWAMSFKQFQAPNPDIFDLVNTLKRMALKRALVGTVAMLGAVSNRFTMDLDDTNARALGAEEGPSGTVTTGSRVAPGKRSPVGPPPPGEPGGTSTGIKPKDVDDMGPEVFGPNWANVDACIGATGPDRVAWGLNIQAKRKDWQTWMRGCLKAGTWDASTAPWRPHAPTTVDSTATPGEATETE